MAAKERSAAGNGMAGRAAHLLDDARRALLAGRFVEARQHYRRVMTAGPAEAAVWFEYGNAALGAHDPDEAVRAYHMARTLEPDYSELVCLIGHQFAAMRMNSDAVACFASAAASDPAALNPRISLVVAHEKAGRLAEARSTLDECAVLDPLDDQVRYLSAVLDRRAGAGEAAESTLRDLLDFGPRHPFVRYAARYELAQLLDSSARPRAAMEQLAAAKEIVRELTDIPRLWSEYDVRAAVRVQTARDLPRDILTKWREQAVESAPVLACGHPRSGTTLLALILGAHPQITAVDESGAFAGAAEYCLPHHARLTAAQLQRLPEVALDATRRRYLTWLQRDAAATSADAVLVDKNPSLTASLPLWLRLHPRARLVMAQRDPRDVVLSCYFQNIPLNAVNANFLTLERTAKHWTDLMAVWHAVKEWSDLTAMEARYEDVTQDFVREGRRMTAFLGLPWAAEQEEFHRSQHTPQLVAPGSGGARQPVHRHRAGRWQAYEEWLAPVLPVLAPFANC